MRFILVLGPNITIGNLYGSLVSANPSRFCLDFAMGHFDGPTKQLPHQRSVRIPRWATSIDLVPVTIRVWHHIGDAPQGIMRKPQLTSHPISRDGGIRSLKGHQAIIACQYQRMCPPIILHLLFSINNR